MTARTGRDRSPLLSPDALAKQLVSLSVGNRIGLVFGPEREGLRNEELSFCHLFVRIPCSGNFPSLNLAQAVMVICYELSKASDHAPERPRHLAESHQLEEMFEHMERTLIDIGFLDPDHPERIMRALRKVFGRSALDEREVRILRGVWSQMDWHLGRKRKTDGGG
jgi:tRNA/rRNA methyltransferase